jgi:predicted amidohydrolase
MTCRLAAIQMDVRLGQIETNLAEIEQQLLQGSARGDNLLVFPECAVTGYCYESLAEAREVAESIPGATTERLASLCRSENVHLVAGMLEMDGPRLFNASVLIGPGGLIGHYRKAHLPYLGVDRFATPGDRPLQIWETALGRIGMLICYDLSFPEAARVLSLAGADLIVLPTNWPPGAEQTADHLVAARALENHIYCAAVNRIGSERGFRFIGGSRICDFHGVTLAHAQHAQPAVLRAELALQRARQKRIVRVPEKHIIDRFADRRPDLYGPLVNVSDKPTPRSGP